jgi:hypothetical protein
LITFKRNIKLAEQEDVHDDGDNHLDGQGSVEADGPVVEDQNKIAKLGEAAEDNCHQFDPVNKNKYLTVQDGNMIEKLGESEKNDCNLQIEED